MRSRRAGTGTTAFADRRSAGVYYAAEAITPAVAEMSFYRLLFFAESPDTPWPRDAAEYTAFSVAFHADKALDLTRPPLDGDTVAWTHPTDYAACQTLADTAREANMVAIRYRSVRHPQGNNLALLTCTVFSRPEPTEWQTWRVRLSAFGVQALCEFPSRRISFDRTAFAGDPRLTALRWDRGKG